MMRSAVWAACLIVFAACVESWKISPGRLSEKTISITTVKKENGADVPIVDPPTRVSGYFTLDGSTKAGKMFYFYFQARKSPSTAPIVLWMTGGPGCSSELAVLYENGPYSLDPSGNKLIETAYGWDVSHHVIFVDQPLGTGFSYSDDDDDTVYSSDQAGTDMLDFLQHFMAAHPDLAKRPLFITGESYAGHYVPAVTHRVWLSNKNQEGPHINLKGLAIGNGLTEPSIQFSSYGDYAVQNGLISQTTRNWMSFLFPICGLANRLCDSTNWDWLCSLGQTYCFATQFQPVLAANPGINVYDITKTCDAPLCYDFSAADRFLNRPDIQAALGVDDIEWRSCDRDVYMNFAGDWLHRFDTVLPDMMADGIRVMIYAGDLDLICNWLGNRRWVDALDWPGSDGWSGAQDMEWGVQGKAAGKVKSFGPLSFVQVYKAGHMVPMDQGANGLAMITAWTRNLSLADNLPVGGATMELEQPTLTAGAARSHSMHSMKPSKVTVAESASAAIHRLIKEGEKKLKADEEAADNAVLTSSTVHVPSGHIGRSGRKQVAELVAMVEGRNVQDDDMMSRRLM